MVKEITVEEVSKHVSSGVTTTHNNLGRYAVYGSTGIIGYTDCYDYCGEKILVARVGTNAGTVNIVDGQYGVSDNTLIIEIIPQYDKKYVYYQLKRLNLYSLLFGSGQPLLTGTQLKKLKFWNAEFKEQKAIAEILSDIDKLMITLQKLIDKKKSIKRGAMLELLTGKRRLPGFDGEWVEYTIGDILSVGHGQSQHSVEREFGIYPILATGGCIGYTDKFLWDEPSVLIGRKGTINKPQYIETPFWTIDTLFYTKIKKEYDAKFLFYKFCLIDWLEYNEASGIPSLSANTIQNIKIMLPNNKKEQSEISRILTDMDNEIEQLEKKLIKYQQIKQGMMQELLTGHIRLVNNGEET